MPNLASRILLAEDEPSVGMSMSLALREAGYAVRVAEDGFSALSEIRQQMPDILLSDLNMPGMSGFELLSVVRRRFPALRTLAMSGAFPGMDIPPGVIADAFYPKGTGMKVLLATLQTLAEDEGQRPEASSSITPLWIHRSGHDSSAEARVTITCPECLRTFSQGLGGSCDGTHPTECLYCHSPIHFAIAPSVDRLPLPTLHSIQAKSEPAPRSAAQHYY